MRTEYAEIISPPIEDLGAVPDDLLAELGQIAWEIKPDNGRRGQVATQVIIGQDTKHPLHGFALRVGEAFLDERPGEGSDVRIKAVTDGGAFAEDPSRIAAATFWHHDYKVTEVGGFSLLDTTRLVIPVRRGTWAAGWSIRV